LVRKLGVGKPAPCERGCHRPIFPHHWLKQSACGGVCPPMPPADVPLGAALRELL
jgi:hypothetical protein